MALASFKDLCLDANDPQVLGPWWSAALDLRFDPHEVAHAVGRTPQHSLWFDRVPEPKTVKHRVHLDIYARSLADLEAAGATVVEGQDHGGGWTVMVDPEGGEFCAFLRDELPDDRLHGLVVDSADPGGIADWWGHVYDAEVVHHEQGYSTVQNIPGMPILTMDFVPVPEPKTLKNRIHWDVVASSLESLAALGARVLRRPDQDISWTVMADPEGNEFCCFS